MKKEKLAGKLIIGAENNKVPLFIYYIWTAKTVLKNIG